MRISILKAPSNLAGENLFNYFTQCFPSLFDHRSHFSCDICRSSVMRNTLKKKKKPDLCQLPLKFRKNPLLRVKSQIFPQKNNLGIPTYIFKRLRISLVAQWLGIWYCHCCSPGSLGQELLHATGVAKKIKHKLKNTNNRPKFFQA